MNHSASGVQNMELKVTRSQLLSPSLYFSLDVKRGGREVGTRRHFLICLLQQKYNNNNTTTYNLRNQNVTSINVNNDSYSN